MLPAATAERIASGAAFVDLSSWTKVAVSGADARTWLNDLVSADVADLRSGEARRSLLLSPTGRIRAEFTVAVQGDAIVLIQDPAQPAMVKDLLARYVLSSDVVLEDRTSAWALFAFPGRDSAPEMAGVSVSAPSCTGAGIDLLCAMRDHDEILESLATTDAVADADALEAWRISAGVPRFGVDATADDLPQEGGFGGAVAFDRAATWGRGGRQVRNLGHPRRVLLHLEAAAPLRAGDPVRAGGEQVGEVTSATESDGRWRVLARVRWRERDGRLEAAGGQACSPSPRMKPIFSGAFHSQRPEKRTFEGLQTRPAR
jgi:folate-binding Fe-S cluster repair protein YgfZ